MTYIHMERHTNEGDIYIKEHTLARTCKRKGHIHGGDIHTEGHKDKETYTRRDLHTEGTFTQRGYSHGGDIHGRV